MTSSVRAFIFCSVILGIGDVFTQRFRFQKYNYDPWTGRTSSVEEFDEDVRNMDSKQLEKYMTELKRVQNGLEDMRRESDILERELGFGLGGFPSLMDNSENIIKHALDSVTDQLQRRIGHDPKLLESQHRFDDRVKSADRPTLQRNLERLQQTKQQITEAKQRAEALKNELGFDFDHDAMKRAESAVDHGMDVINHRIQKLDHPHDIHPHASNANVTNAKWKVDQALQNADQQRLTKFDNEFKRMKQYMDNVRSQLDTFHRDIGFEFDGIFEPFKMAESVLDHGLSSIVKQLHGAPHQQSVSTGPQQGAGAYNQQYPTVGYNQQNPQGNQPNPAGGPQPNPAGGPQPTVAGSQQQSQTTVQSG